MNSNGSNQGPACDHPPDVTAGAEAPLPKRLSLPWRRLRVALALALLGVAFSLWLASRLHREGLDTDQRRFDLECVYMAAHVESTMERYEERLARLADACAQDPLMVKRAWGFKRGEWIEVPYNLPAVLQLAYCPKVRPEDYEAHRAQGRATWGDAYAFDPPATGGGAALPVWMSYTHAGYEPLIPGVDIRQDNRLRPLSAEGMRRPAGWVSGAPAFLPKQEGPPQVGYWFVLLLFKPDQPDTTWSIARETPAHALDRRRSFHAEVATGLLAAFISADQLLDGSFKTPSRPRNVHTRLYASKEPSLEQLLNSATEPLVNHRYRKVITQPWYGRKWCLEFTSTRLFEEQSQRYRAWLAAGVGIPLSLLVAGFIGYQAVLHERTRLAARDLAESRDALRHAQTEREKLSRDLHDGAIQSLYALQLGLMNTARRLERESPVAADELAAARAGLDSVIAELRQFILHQGSAEPKAARTNLADVLHALAQRPHVHQQTQVAIECDAVAAERVSPRQAVQLANIAREALSNALRHASASRIALRLSQGPTEVRLEIEDDGRGFDPNQARTAGQGLANMQRRAEEEGGALTIASQPDTGTRLAVSLPVQAEEPSRAHPETD